MSRVIRAGRFALVGIPVFAAAAFLGAYITDLAPHPGFCACSICDGRTDPGAPTAQVSISFTEPTGYEVAGS